MKTEKVTVSFEIGNKISSHEWPLPPPNNHLLTEEQLKIVDKIIREETSDTKRHFKDGSWDLDGSIIAAEVLYRIFGCHIEDYIVARIANACKVSATWTDKGPRLINKTPKVFYRPKGNLLYVDTRARNVELDVQVGEL